MGNLFTPGWSGSSVLAGVAGFWNMQQDHSSARNITVLFLFFFFGV